MHISRVQVFLQSSYDLKLQDYAWKSENARAEKLLFLSACARQTSLKTKYTSSGNYFIEHRVL